MSPRKLSVESGTSKGVNIDVNQFRVYQMMVDYNLNKQGHKTLVPQVISALKEYGRGDILVIAGGVIPQKDHDLLYKAGVSGVFGPGSVIAESAIDILEKLMK